MHPNLGRPHDGVLNRYQNSILIGGNQAANGYGLAFNRGDANFADSRVALVIPGAPGVIVPSSFQFGASIDVVFTFGVDGRVSGSVSGDRHTFAFNFGSLAVSFPGSDLAINLGSSDSRSTVITNQTVDNLRVCRPM